MVTLIGHLSLAVYDPPDSLGSFDWLKWVWFFGRPLTGRLCREMCLTWQPKYFIHVD